MMDTLVFGHRGASASAPENTLPAFAAAVTQNADGVEVDIRRTVDDHLVLHHNPSVSGHPPIVDLTLEELRSIAPTIPTLDELLLVTGDLTLNLEIKNDPKEPDFDPDNNVAAAVTTWIADHQLYRRAIVTSFNWSTVGLVRTLDDRVITGQLLDRGAEIDTMMLEIAAVGHLWVAPHHSSLAADPAAKIDAAHDLGLKVIPWTLDDHSRTAELAALGLDAVITNDPEGAVAALGF